MTSGEGGNSQNRKLAAEGGVWWGELYPIMGALLLILWEFWLIN